LVVNPATGTTQTGKPYARATVASDVGGEADVMVGMFVMDEGSIHALERAKKADSVAAQGNLQPNSYTGKDGSTKHGLNLSFARVLTVRQPRRDRE
jgi:hypothetical protein